MARHRVLLQKGLGFRFPTFGEVPLWGGGVPIVRICKDYISVPLNQGNYNVQCLARA